MGLKRPKPAPTDRSNFERRIRRLRQLLRPYDRAVAGVISGAENERPGIILGHQPGENRRLPIALSGRVY
jgi:hypothetical protein